MIMMSILFLQDDKKVAQHAGNISYDIQSKQITSNWDNISMFIHSKSPLDII